MRQTKDEGFRAETDVRDIQELSERLSPSQLRELREFATKLYATDEQKMQVILPQGVDVAVQRYDPRASLAVLMFRRWVQMFVPRTDNDVKILAPKGLEVVVRHYEPPKQEWRIERIETRGDDQRDRRAEQEDERQFRESRRDREIPSDREAFRSRRDEGYRAQGRRDEGRRDEGRDEGFRADRERDEGFRADRDRGLPGASPLPGTEIPNEREREDPRA